jgi:anionic cell wall polymer biosynthesis LytR-Cps2A-Psr (LCP) family protein
MKQGEIMKRGKRVLGAWLLAVVMSGAGAWAAPVAASVRDMDAMPWLGLAAELAGPILPSTIYKGGDNRLTVLFVGSDWRPQLAGTGERFDSIIVATIDNSKRISAVSIPRDIKNFPIGPGEVFKPGIYGLFKAYKQASNGDRNVALGKFKAAIAYGLDTPIDYIVYTRFTGLERLVTEVDGVPVTVAKTIYDTRIHDDRYPSYQDGAKFLAQQTLEIGANAPACYTVGSPINWAATPNCVRALEYVRSRHGKDNNDWVRSRRQQGFIYDAIRRVISRGSGSNLDSLRVAALSNTTDFYTTLPTSTSDVIAMYNLLNGSTLVNQAVFKPYTYASNIPGTHKQQLKIDVVRSLMHSWFGPLP